MIAPQAPTSNSRRLSPWNYLLWPAFLLLFVVNGVNLARSPLQVDLAWYLHIGREMLAGKRLYIDILEVNPPLVCFLSEIPNWVGIAFHLDVKRVWIAFASLLIAIPAVLCIFLMDPLNHLSGWRRSLTGLVLAVVCVIPFYPVFGERDHLAFAALLPLVFLGSLRISGLLVPLPLAIFVSTWAGIFLALKPFFLIPLALCFAFVWWKIGARTFRLPEFYVVPLFALLNLLLILFVTPSYMDVARLASRWYGGYDIPRTKILGTLALPAWLFVSHFLFRPTPAYASVFRLTGLTTGGWILSALVQHKGFDYHLVPPVAGSALLCYFVVLDLWDRPFWKQIAQLPVWASAMVFFIALFCYVFYQEWHFEIPYNDNSNMLLPILRSHGSDRVMVLSTSMAGYPAISETNVVYDNASSCFWTMPGLYKNSTGVMDRDTNLPFHDLSALPVSEREIFDTTYRDLLLRPRLIIVDAHHYKTGMGPAIFNFEDYFLRDVRIAKLWREYRELPPVPYFRIYELEEAAAPNSRSHISSSGNSF